MNNSLHFDRIGALAIYVTDKKRSVNFYTTILGFEMVVDLGPNLCFLKSTNGDINIYLKAGKKPADIDHNTARLGFFIHCTESAQKAYTNLKNSGITILQECPEPVDDHTACFQLLDPDGNIIDVCGPV